MKNKRILFFGSTICALVLFSCATGNKVSKVSFGGGWAEASSAPKKEVKAHAEVAANPAGNTEVAESVQSIHENPVTVAEQTVPGNNTSIHAEVKSVNNKPAKLGFRQKMASKMISKQLNNPADTHDGDKLLYVIVAILIPWLGVLLYEGGITSNFWITLLLWFLFYLPGLIYALLVILDYI